MSIAAPPGFLVGDGSSATTTGHRRARRYGWLAAVVGTTLLVVVLLAVMQSPTSTTPLSVANAGDEGARATAEILRDHGVKVTEVSHLEQVADAAGEGGTLVIATYGYLSEQQLDSILDWQGPVVWLEPHDYDLTEISSTLEGARVGGDDELEAHCDDPLAARAESIVAPGARLNFFSGGEEHVECFGTPGGGYVAGIIERDGAGPITVIAAPSFLTNEYLTQAGNASYAFNLLGTQPRIAWYTGAGFDDSVVGGSGSATTPVLAAPAWMNLAMGAALLSVIFLAIWRGRRLGPLVYEPLPILVHASEATKGRARLYRRGRAVGHAAAAMRAGAAARLAKRLGLGQTATRTSIVAAVASATGRDGAEVDALIYGPPPADEAAMIDLVRRLDALEREVDPT